MVAEHGSRGQGLSVQPRLVPRAVPHLVKEGSVVLGIRVEGFAPRHLDPIDGWRVAGPPATMVDRGGRRVAGCQPLRLLDGAEGPGLRSRVRDPVGLLDVERRVPAKHRDPLDLAGLFVSLLEPLPEHDRRALLTLPNVPAHVLRLLEGEPVRRLPRLAPQQEGVDSPVGLSAL